VVTTLHGTDTTLLGNDPGYGPAILHALNQSDAVTTVSQFLKRETRRVLDFSGSIEVIPNFFDASIAKRSRDEIRAELGVTENEALIIHSSNLRPGKRIDFLLETLSLIRPRASFKVLVLAGESFAPFQPEVERLGLKDRCIVLENILDVENYLQAADLGLITSENESFCLSILEAMTLGCPSVATAVGGIPELVLDQETGFLVPFGDPRALARAVERLIGDIGFRSRLGVAARADAEKKFSSKVIVPLYESLYRKVVG
jgi:N-acetyl-alpha-D-glucosaminyl L-malate synthase BshA